jgi:murein DD-endopeptidase MepM/ murein hydrolase activator NlpD
MLSIPTTLSRFRGDSAGFCRPVPGAISSGFGARLFPAHLATVGYDYDLHPGVDFHTDAGDPVLAPMAGAVCRAGYTFFGWEDASQLLQWEEVDTASSAAFALSGGNLQVTAARVGSQTFPTNVAYIRPIRQRVAIVAATPSDWLYEIEFASPPSVVGGVGIALLHNSVTEYIGIEYDGTTITCRGVDSTGALANDGTTSAQSDKTWLRIEYATATSTYSWKYSTDGETWTTIASESGRTFTRQVAPNFAPIIYWRSGDTNATPYTIDINRVNWTASHIIDRFGNFLVIAKAGFKCVLAHLQTPYVGNGDIVHAGQLIGTVGATGVDSISGRINTPHLHLEMAANNSWSYARSESINPLGVGLLPRTNSDANVSVVRSTAADPDAVSCHLLEVTETRGDSDLDVNTITMVGSLATRTINLNTRAGINPTDPDIPKYDGVYIVPTAFDENSATRVTRYYFDEAILGTFVSYSIGDTAGTVLASE